MTDPRITKLAHILVDYSVCVRKNDHVRLQLIDEGLPLLKEVYRLCIQRGAIVRVNIADSSLAPVFYQFAREHQIAHFPKLDMAEAKWLTCSIGIYGDHNTRNLSGANSAKMAKRSQVLRPIRDRIVNEKRWVICNYPSHGLAQDAEMSLDEYADFVFGATNVNWQAVSRKQDKLKKVLDKGKLVQILGPGTDLQFSIKGRKAIKCDGQRNMPDGEVFIAPDEYTAEGSIRYDFPGIYRGKEVEGIELSFEKGVVVSACARKNQAYLRAMINIDPGAKRIGEFGIGTNYGIKKFTRDILFDEKIGGTIHLALGKAYEEGGGKNKSALHWDMIKDLRKKGEIRVDGKVIEKNGKLSV